MKARDLGLIEPALSAAIALEERFPDIVFTSGRRSREDQARAMAQNVALAGRGWITRTYRPSPMREAIVQELRRLPHVKEASNIQARIMRVLGPATDEMAAGISKHLGGLAFDVKPMIGQNGKPTARGLEVIAALVAMPQTGKFLSHEGGLVRWHWQAK